MNKIRSHGKETQSDMKKSDEVALPVDDKRRYFKCGKTRHVKKDCPKKGFKRQIKLQRKCNYGYYVKGKAMKRQCVGRTQRMQTNSPQVANPN